MHEPRFQDKRPDIDRAAKRALGQVLRMKLPLHHSTPPLPMTELLKQLAVMKRSLKLVE